MLTEFDEQMDSGKQQAIITLRQKALEYFRGDESMGVLSAYERAAVLTAGLTWSEADSIIAQAKTEHRASF